MTPMWNEPSVSLEDAVETLLGLLNPSSVGNLVEAQEEQLVNIQNEFAEKLSDYWGLDEEQLLRLCSAQDLDAAASTLMKATWSQARARWMH